jgi:hypothetical protein
MFYEEFDDEEGVIAQDDALEQMILDEECSIKPKRDTTRENLGCDELGLAE